jgi:hypothetical protein
MKKYVIGLLLSGMMPLLHAFPMSDGASGSQIMVALDVFDSALSDDDSRSDCMLRLSESMFEINHSPGGSCGGMSWVYEIDEDARLSVRNGAGGGESGANTGDDVQDFDSSLFGSVGSGSYLETGDSAQQNNSAVTERANDQALTNNHSVQARSNGIRNSTVSISEGQQASRGLNVAEQKKNQAFPSSLIRRGISGASTASNVSSTSSVSMASEPSAISSGAPAMSGGVSAGVGMSAPSRVSAPSAASAAIPPAPEHSVISTSSLTGLTAADLLSVINPLVTEGDAMTQSSYAPSSVSEPYSLLLLFLGLGLLSMQRKSKSPIMFVPA